MTIRHELVLMIDQLINIKSSDDWESQATPELKEKMQSVINDLDNVWFQFRQLTTK